MDPTVHRIATMFLLIEKSRNMVLGLTILMESDKTLMNLAFAGDLQWQALTFDICATSILTVGIILKAMFDQSMAIVLMCFIWVTIAHSNWPPQSP